MKDSNVIELFQKGKEEIAFNKLYRYFSKVEGFVKNNWGTTEEAKDLFQEALIIVYNKIKSDNFILTASLETYLFSVCKYMWSDCLKEKNKKNAISEYFESHSEPDFSSEVEYQNKINKAEKALQAIGDKCLHLLKLFYYESMSMKLIAKKLHFKTENVAKNFIHKSESSVTCR